jgi:hypothetical protein
MMLLAACWLCWLLWVLFREERETRIAFELELERLIARKHKEG